jgi:mono/diheme cytochrome c family protein
MKQKTRKTLGAIGAIWLAFAASATSLAAPVDSAPSLSAAQKKNPVLVRGQYLVEQVGLCADCHTPRNEKGQFLSDRWLAGSPLAFQPTVPMPWSPAAPPIAGLPTLTEAQALVFLQTGKRADGSAPLPPMPEYRFNAQDARAVVAYLKSLGTKPANTMATSR